MNVPGDGETADAVVVGGGPGGAVLAYLLARGGARVTLVESRGDFNRRFRGDTLSPSVLHYLDQLGLADELLAEIPHRTADAFRWHVGDRVFTLADYRGADPRFPYFALIPQARFLPWLIDRARVFPGFEVRMGGRVSALARDTGGRVTGVRLSGEGGVTGGGVTGGGVTGGGGRGEELPARVVVGADGRNSKMRALAGAVATELGSALDLVWFAVPRRPGDPPLSGLQLFSAPGALLAVLNQDTDWQLGYTIPAGTFAGLRDGGPAPVVEAFSRQLPWLADRMSELRDTAQLTLLNVRITTVDSWYRPGILLIGDAAHVISPVGGNGINFAIADAAETANRLLPVLLNPAGGAQDIDAACRAVEAARRPPVERDQRRQVRIEAGSRRRLESGKDGVPLAFRIIDGVPGLAHWAGRRSANAVRIPAPSPDLFT